MQVRQLSLAFGFAVSFAAFAARGDFMLQRHLDADPGGAGGTDYSDAPSPYPIASHPGTSYQWLGPKVSDEGSPRVVDTFDDGVMWDPQDVVLGNTFELTFESTSTYETEVIVGVWIDWNQDGGWASLERVVDWEGTVFPSGSGFHTAVTETISVPLEALLGETWLRARLNWAHSYTAPDMSPTAYQLWGEVEDYAIHVVPEPTTIVLIVCGLVGLAISGRLGRGIPRSLGE